MRGRKREEFNDRNRERNVGPPTKKFCRFCENKTIEIDYKNIKELNRYISERGKIVRAKVSGVCANCQRQLNKAIKHARFVGLIPYLSSSSA